MDDSTVIRWEEPRRDWRRSADSEKWFAVAAALAQRPGQWAVIQSLSSMDAYRATSIIRMIKTGSHEAFAPAGSFEAVQRKSAEGQNVYARMVAD